MVSHTTRRKFLQATGAAGTVLAAGCSGFGGGNEFPNKPITFKVIADAGGGYDFYTRLVAKYIKQEDLLPVDIKIENLTMSLIGRFNNIYNSDADGYTYGNVWPGFARIQAQGVEGVEYDVTKVTPMPSAGGNLRAFAVSPDLDEVNNAQDLISYIQAGKAKFYTTGVRSTGTIMPVLFGELGNLYDLKQVMNNYVVYDGSAQGMTGMKRGEINTRGSSLSSVIQYVKSGDLKPILVLTTDETVPDLYKKSLNDVQTLADVDVENKEKIQSLTSFQNYWNFCGPPDVPEEKANVVREAMSKAIQLDAFKEEANKASRAVSYADAQTVGDDLKQKVDLWNQYLPLLDKMEQAAGG